MSPAMVAAAAVNGHLADVRPLLQGKAYVRKTTVQDAAGQEARPAVAVGCGATMRYSQVIPARYLKVARADGLGMRCSATLRFDADGRPRPDFPLNDPARQCASIMIGRKNSDVGSSREAAVYALVDHGIRCVVATSFGDIFAAMR